MVSHSLKSLSKSCIFFFYILSIKDNTSNYFGVKSNNESTNSNSKKNESQSVRISNKIDTVFEWSYEGDSVLLTGSFLGWEKFIPMTKNEKNEYKITIKLNKGFHQYKFKVNGIWKYNDKFPIYIDHGYINNYIDTSNINEDFNRKFKIKPKLTSEPKNLKEKILINNIKVKKSEPSENMKNIMKNYTNLYPKQEEMKVKSSTIPSLYNKIFNININSFQNKIGSEKYLKLYENNTLSDNLSYKRINYYKHIYINHQQNRIINKTNKYYNTKTIITSLVSRFRNKQTTFLYFSKITDD